MATYNFNVPNARLNANEIFGSIYNMIISQQVFADNVKGVYGSLVDKFRTDGTLYGDTKLFYSTDALATQVWTNDAEAQNLLMLHRPNGPEVQAVTIDQFRMIPLTVDNYLTKRAWSTEGAFSSFNSVMLSWMRETKRIYDATLINTFVGTTESEATRAIVEIETSTAIADLTGEEKNRVQAQTIAQGLADLMVDMKDISRDFNDYGNLRSYDESDLMVVWNSKYVNKITKLDLPTIFHKDGIFNDFSNVLPARYFGHVVDTIDTTYTGTVTSAQKGVIRALAEKDYTVSNKTTHCFAGDALPVGATYVANEVYAVADDIICKIVHKNAVPFMSAFETATSFFNPRSLTETHYLIWGYSDPVYLKDKAFITVEED